MNETISKSRISNLRFCSQYEIFQATNDLVILPREDEEEQADAKLRLCGNGSKRGSLREVKNEDADGKKDTVRTLRLSWFLVSREHVAAQPGHGSHAVKRFEHVLRMFLQALYSPESPLVLFLDDFRSDVAQPSWTSSR